MPPAIRITLNEFRDSLMESTDESIMVETILALYPDNWMEDDNGFYTSKTKVKQMQRNFFTKYAALKEMDEIQGENKVEEATFVEAVMEKTLDIIISTKEYIKRLPFYIMNNPHEEILKVVVVKKPNDIRIKVFPRKSLTEYEDHDIIIGNLSKPVSVFIPASDNTNAYQTTIKKDEFIQMNFRG